MSLIPYRRYEVKAEHIEGGEEGRNLQVNIPVIFLRDRARAGEFIVVNFDGDNKNQLVITVSKANGNGAPAGETPS